MPGRSLPMNQRPLSMELSAIITFCCACEYAGGPGRAGQRPPSQWSGAPLVDVDESCGRGNGWADSGAAVARMTWSRLGHGVRDYSAAGLPSDLAEMSGTRLPPGLLLVGESPAPPQRAAAEPRPLLDQHDHQW